MLQIGAGEFLVIALLALVVLGPERLPHAARFVGQLFGSVRSMAGSFQTEIERASDGLIENAAREKGQLQIDLERLEATAGNNQVAQAAKNPPTDPVGTTGPTETSEQRSGTDQRNSPASATETSKQPFATDQISSAAGTNSATAATTAAPDNTPAATTAAPDITASVSDAAPPEASEDDTGGPDGQNTDTGAPDPGLIRREPDRREKPQSATMYAIDDNGETPTSLLHADVEQMLTNEDLAAEHDPDPTGAEVSRPGSTTVDVQSAEPATARGDD